ncbi:MAG: hypothetical protein WDN75_06960 [Bacteroidota bacterium]
MKTGLLIGLGITTVGGGLAYYLYNRKKDKVTLTDDQQLHFNNLLSDPTQTIKSSSPSGPNAIDYVKSAEATLPVIAFFGSMDRLKRILSILLVMS